ncbi:signal transduction histidine kinase/DNA-binding response OmpR family regulator [Lewinella marina]|nr:ATP-binding protein [Neolewinella marina]NJB87748.1 signal transduction histidine kinase/DNA-binding response OmpR family regulator [Neolewinella marina]
MGYSPFTYGILWWLFFFLSLPLRAAEGETGNSLLVLDDPLTNYRLVDYVELLPDSALPLSEVTDRAFTSYRAYDRPVEAGRWYWGRFTLVNRLPDAGRHTEWVVFFPGTWTTLEVYVPGADGRWRAEPNGTFTPVADRPFVPTTKGNLVKLALPPDQPVTVYFRGLSERPTLRPSFHLYLQTTEVFYDKLMQRRVANAVFIGFLGMMLVYNLILYFFGRDRSFIYYSGYLLMMIVYACYFTDDLSDWFGRTLFATRPQYYGFFKLSIFVGLMCYLSFIRSFTDLRQLLPRWDRYFHWLILLGFPLMAVYVGVSLASNFSYLVEDFVTVGYIVLVIGSCGVLLYPLYRARDKKGAFVFAGIAALCIGALLSLLSRVLLPPFTLFYLEMGVAVEVLIFSLGLAYRQRKLIMARKQSDLALRESRLLQEKQQLEADRQRELAEFKSRFYTNITHEFRTPLTVILGMSEQINGHERERELIGRNGRQLLGLVNQLLDLSRLESGSVGVHYIHDDIVAYLRYLTESFYSAAERRSLRFLFYSEENELLMDYDETKVMQIVNNLISNALKFTPAYGKVVVHTSRARTEEGEWLKLIVQDSGIGISSEDRARVFDRFFQVNGAAEGGTGVGLALTRELVDILGGTIEVRSEPGAGTTFEVRLPIRDDYRTAAPSTPGGSYVEGRPELLVIEDNPDIIAYLQTILVDRYNCHFATDGDTGIERALELVPDVILSDVLMPGKDGYEVCQTLKADERTSHIPIILLTAKTTQAARLDGLRYGADAFLTKPFDKDELHLRLEKLIEVRKQLQHHYTAAGTGDAAAGEEVSREEAFLEKLHTLIHDHLDDAGFGVSELAAAAHLSKMQLYRKIKALTGKTPSRFIRSYRLSRGMLLLREGQYTVSEVAYAVGFSDPSYFSRTFQQEYQHSPSHYLSA